MSDPHFFGYGSLVNLATHSYPDPQLARLDGWRRVWRHTNARPVAYLSVEPDALSHIDGIIAKVPGANWEALDHREAAYARRDVTTQITCDARPDDIAVYQVPAPADGVAQEHPILLSYLDVVVQGYLNLFGEAGAKAFFASTDGWSAPITDDRTDPQYPRHQELSAGERRTVDQLLATARA